MKAFLSAENVDKIGGHARNGLDRRTRKTQDSSARHIEVELLKLGWRSLVPKSKIENGMKSMNSNDVTIVGRGAESIRDFQKDVFLFSSFDYDLHPRGKYKKCNCSYQIESKVSKLGPVIFPKTCCPEKVCSSAFWHDRSAAPSSG